MNGKHSNKYTLTRMIHLKNVSVIVHEIEFMNRRLCKAQYFFTEIC